ncbi:uncharacterized protein LOC134183687 isoform X2 [Corticium candelabrum]|uniref:uncharacterized protein LOC134183687 isoform X2 n=1 Tax=Corticium candelabrum TaxID=121492 RepID=UPI002E255D9E|nr:uncharacterized protein LOC134183687 isoform X2 [Corticium candelabrum]
MCEAKHHWHNLTKRCSSNNVEDIHSLPETVICSLGFIQAITFACIILMKYNWVFVLNERVSIPMTSSWRWVLFFVMLAFRYSVYAIGNGYESDNKGVSLRIIFIAGMSLEGLMLFFLAIALYHEYKYRSTVLASQGGFFRHSACKHCCRQFWISGQSLCFLLLAASLLLLAIAERAIESDDDHSSVCKEGNYLLWASSGLLFGLIAIVFIMALLSVAKQGEDAPTRTSKIALVISLLLMIPSLIPIAILREIGDGQIVNCSMNYLSPFDLFQLMAFFSWLLFLFYIRAEYHRVLQECKHAIVGDIQSLLNFDQSHRARDSHV